ncbi:MAG: hypothetical protein R2788_22180 [Saprospiraceae bacterium]
MELTFETTFPENDVENAISQVKERFNRDDSAIELVEIGGGV